MAKTKKKGGTMAVSLGLKGMKDEMKRGKGGSASAALRSAMLKLSGEKRAALQGATVLVKRALQTGSKIVADMRQTSGGPYPCFTGRSGNKDGITACKTADCSAAVSRAMSRATGGMDFGKMFGSVRSMAKRSGSYTRFDAGRAFSTMGAMAARSGSAPKARKAKSAVVCLPASQLSMEQQLAAVPVAKAKARAKKR